MREPFNVIKVVSKETNKVIEIKDVRFNPEFHKHIDDMTPEDEAKEVTTDNTEKGFEYNGKVYKTEAAMKSAITRDSKK